MDLIRYLWPSLRSHLLVYRKAYVTLNINTTWQSLPACSVTYLTVDARQQCVSSASSHRTACFTSRTCSPGFSFFLACSRNCEKRLSASSCVSVCTLAPTGRIFMKFDLYFSKIVERIQVSLKYEKNNGYCTR